MDGLIVYCFDINAPSQGELVGKDEALFLEYYGLSSIGRDS